jgi:membrane-associated protein
MEYRTFLFYNVFGGISWIVSMLLFGYYLIPIADPPMQALLGKPDFTWAKHIDKVVVVVVVLSVLPMVWKAAKHWLDKRKPSKLVTATIPTPVTTATDATPTDAPAATSVPTPVGAESPKT